MRSSELILVRACSLEVITLKIVMKPLCFVTDKLDVVSKSFWAPEIRISANMALKVTIIVLLASRLSICIE
jgi:hypothetical protein